MTFGHFKYLPRRSISHRVLRDRDFNIHKKYDEYQRGLTLLISNFFKIKYFRSVVKSETMQTSIIWT